VPPVPFDPPRGDPQTGYTVYGTVFESDGTTRRPVRGGSVYYWVGPYDGFGSNVPVDSNGRYLISKLHDRQQVRVTAHAGSGDLVQQCAVNTTINLDTMLDIDLVPPGTSVGAGRPLTLTGVVSEITADGRRPVADAPVVYYSIFRVPFDVYTRTDSSGRYEFCGIPAGAGELLAGDCHDAMMRTSVNLRSGSTMDIDLTEFNAKCPR
jgi:hypothetical protein